MEKIIITIGRQFGSGGRELGKKLAEKINISYYDKEIIDVTAAKSGLSKEYILQNDETATNSFLYSLVMGTRILSGQKTVEEIKIDAQREAIREIAGQGGCVIIGRAADYILRDQNPFRIFISANEEDRVERVCKRDHVSPDEALKKIHKMDKMRAVYYNEYADAEWGKASNYDLCINLTKISVEKAIEMIRMNF
ncbi:cytidylate kinase-like family protein [Clostridium sp. AM58-1XD]|uniref:cytidylate kinase-like family protein n=1 Tax=Clostridium sp. AM58-1XD TaxID=2292307 RepID=UPI000E5384F8|nr:cytidylate kinase-like family protein [Clostridium sp. AM58-1XD]RGY98239.1 cytidylate kinase-like family protein [Clostridium sp. AM58-1XD]